VLDREPASSGWVDGVLEGGCSLRTELPTVDGTVRIALDVDHLAVFDIDVLTTANRTVGANAVDYSGVTNAWAFSRVS